MKDDCCKPSKERKIEKHLLLDEAIFELLKVEGVVNELFADITQGPREECAGCDRPIPSLVDVLDNGPQRIRNSCERIKNVLTEIRISLFGKDIKS